jgi:hypothetical protein
MEATGSRRVIGRGLGAGRSQEEAMKEEAMTQSIFARRMQATFICRHCGQRFGSEADFRAHGRRECIMKGKDSKRTSGRTGES